MITNIYFIRHAESPFIFGKERERPLSEEGKKSAEKLTHSLRNIQFDRVFSSPYKRAIETLDGLVEKSEIIMKEELKERPIKGDYKISEIELDRALKESFQNIDFCLAGGETIRDAQYRSLPIIFSILENKELENVAIGTHGNIMTSIIKYFDNSIGYDFWKSTEKPDVYKLTFDGYCLSNMEKVTF